MRRKMNIGKRRQVSSAIRAAAFEVLEDRRLLSAAPTFVAIADGTQNFGNTQRSIAYYDVSEIGNSANPQDVFNSNPLFSVWVGYEITFQNNYEEISALAVNPANGDTYMLAFDSGTVGVPDDVGDTQGDYDLYHIDFAAIYSDFISNNRPRGIMYHPAVASDGFDAIANYGSATPNVGGGLGIHPGRSNADGDTTNDFVFIENAISKVGEIARVQQSGSVFFDQQDLQFVDSGTLLLTENRPSSSDTGALTNDYQLRSIERVSKLPGQASVTGDTGGYNRNTTESWQSFAWTGDNYFDMDNNADTSALSDIDGMRYVEQDGVRGVWVSDRDGGGDDFSFFKLDFATRTAQKQELTLAGAKAFALDNDPVADANSNDGNVDFFDVDENGKLIIGESGFYDSPQTEPKIITHEVTNYNTSPTRITRGGWTATAPITIAQDDDADVANGRFGTFERGKDYAYYFDIDSGAEPSVRADVYVVDVATGQVVYEELDAINHFTVENKIRFFTLGDYVGSDDSIINGDGIVNADDIDAQAARIADPTQGGRYSAAVGNEMFDLDGDNMLTTGNPLGFFSISGDRDYLIRRVLGTEYGDADLNGLLDAGDQAQLDFGISFGLDRWDFGDYDGDGDADADDQAILDFALAFNPNPIRI